MTTEWKTFPSSHQTDTHFSLIWKSIYTKVRFRLLLLRFGLWVIFVCFDWLNRTETKSNPFFKPFHSNTLIRLILSGKIYSLQSWQLLCRVAAVAAGNSSRKKKNHSHDVDTVWHCYFGKFHICTNIEECDNWNWKMYWIGYRYIMMRYMVFESPVLYLNWMIWIFLCFLKRNFIFFFFFPQPSLWCDDAHTCLVE